MRVRLGHSPDSDDAFMFYGLAEHKVPTEGFEFEHILQDIETLNHWACEGRLEITAISVHAYATVADKYAILTHGASMGDNYGPIVVTREPASVDWLRGRRIAIPGTMTSAYLALRLFLGVDFPFDIIPFDQIMEAVRDGQADAGLLIHEGQLTHGQFGLHQVVDLGAWWHTETGGLPLPLGVNAVRRDLGAETMAGLSRVLKASIAYGLEHREPALKHAMRYARGLEVATADQFVSMYVNDWTLDLGARGQQSIRQFLERAHTQGIIAHAIPVDFVA
ncbi:MAG TPA: MqnA/MqnD/SBP family protein [Ktedonobacterales bacterium]|jgi:1,4-dihydroxy-6-naphthoate synthase|nr:MqnA/MqnD/SBP family protein [Ktedonobacterales bacterium]